MYIYKITNIITSKIYVGKTKRSINNRLKSHLYDAFKRKNNTQIILYNSMKKYGKENFIIEELEKCNSLEQLGKRETYWIKTLNSKSPNGYNMTDGGDGLINPDINVRNKISNSVKNLWLNDTYKDRQKKSHLKENLSEESLQNMRNGRKKQKSSGMKNKKHTNETKEKISNKVSLLWDTGVYNKIYSLEHKRKISESIKKHWILRKMKQTTTKTK